MTDTAEFPYRIANSWVSVSTLEGSSAYLLTAFPVQSDQFSANVNPWGPPADDITTFPQYTRYGQYASQGAWADGPVSFDWGLKYLTEIMQYYFENLMWGSDFGVQTIPATIKTRRAADTNAFAVYQGLLNRPKPNVDYKRGVRGVNDYIIHFVGGNLIT